VALGQLVNNFFCDDSEEVLKTIPDESYDCIFTDPPYNASNDDNKVSIRDRHYFTVEEEWDKDYNIRWMLEGCRVLKTGGTLLVFCSHHMLGEYLTRFKEWKGEMNFRQILHWKKRNPVFSVRSYYTFSIEYIIWITKGDGKEKYTFHREEVKRHTGMDEMTNGMFAGHDIFITPICGGKERFKHPTQKPLKLLQKIMLIHTNPGDLILDCYAGSGSMGVAAVSIGRRYTLIEKEPKYVEFIMQRMSQTSLFRDKEREILKPSPPTEEQMHLFPYQKE